MKDAIIIVECSIAIATTIILIAIAIQYSQIQLNNKCLIKENTNAKMD